ncbi:hypothetical protein JKP88DRAFT_274754 [Tribonema minus]|uniref:Uncharacterized protein n=1 Tax=Tribonema minus TaxID=303371 RepID=A0A835ZKU8_9STRA|nr:hypothetical protein JKP88DRAFT_274754 [Tribonema minus]
MSQPPMRASFDLGLIVGHVQRRVPSGFSDDSMHSPEGLKRFKLEEADLLDAQTAVAALFKEGESRFPGIGVCWRKHERITHTDSAGWRKDVEDVAIVRLERCTFEFYDVPVDFCYDHDDSQLKVVKASQCGLLLPPGPPPPESALAAIKKVAAEKGIPDALAELRKHCQELGWAEPAPHMIGGVQSHQPEETQAVAADSTDQSAMIIACNDAGMEFKTRALIKNLSQLNAREDSFIALPLPPLNVTDNELAMLSAAHAACRDVLQRSSRFVDLPVGPGEGGVKREDLECVVEFVS